MTQIGFKKDLETLINTYSIENGSNTPDFILAQYLIFCLETFNRVMQERSRWYEELQTEADPGEMDGDPTSALASAGFGTDEDYGGSGEHF